MNRKLETIVNSYLTCALWASSDSNDVPLDTNYDIDDFTLSFFEKAEIEIVDFIAECGTMLNAWTDEQIGHDFWLTRCGHGAGFWDRNLPYGDEISKLVGHGTKFKNIDLYVTDDNKVDGE